MLLTIGLIMIGWAIWLWKSSPVEYPEKPMKEREEPQYTEEFTEWRKHIFNARNGKA